MPLSNQKSKKALGAAKGYIRDIRAALQLREDTLQERVIKKHRLFYFLKRVIVFIRVEATVGAGSGDETVRMRGELPNSEKSHDEEFFLRQANYLRNGFVHGDCTLEQLNGFCNSPILDKIKGGIGNYLNDEKISRKHRLTKEDFTGTSLYQAIGGKESKQPEPLKKLDECLEELQFCIEANDPIATVGCFESIAKFFSKVKNDLKNKEQYSALAVCLSNMVEKIHRSSYATKTIIGDTQIKQFVNNGQLDEFCKNVKTLLLAGEIREIGEAIKSNEQKIKNMQLLAKKGVEGADAEIKPLEESNKILEEKMNAIEQEIQKASQRFQPLRKKKKNRARQSTSESSSESESDNEKLKKKNKKGSRKSVAYKTPSKLRLSPEKKGDEELKPTGKPKQEKHTKKKLKLSSDVTKEFGKKKKIEKENRGTRKSLKKA